MPKELTYNQLRELWYAKLKKAGFQDIEDDKGYLLKYHSYKFADKSFDHTPEQMEIVQAYYSQAGELLEVFAWKDKTHKRIWELHTEGKTLKEISTALKTGRFRKLAKSQIDRVIKQYQQYIK